jgi:phenylacetate-CoA ligase
MPRLYEKLPVFAQNLVCDVYGLQMRRQRFGRAFEAKLRELLESEWWDSDAIVAYQDSQVRDLVRHAYTHVPFYRDRMRAERITPDDIRGVRDLAALPITTKADVREHAARLQAEAAGHGAMVKMHTSGTTATSLQFAVDRDAIPFRWAVWWRHRARFGVRPGEWHVNFTGKPVVPASADRPPFWRRSRPLQQYLVNMQQLTPDHIESLARDLDVRGARFFSGYPSVVHVYCRLIVEAGIQLERPPRFVFTGAENMLDQQRRDIEAATGATLSDQYGFTEGCGNASHCEHFVYHEDFEYGVLECVDPEPLSGGETRGRIVATGFASHGFPFIRYDVGDIGVWANDDYRCPCGRASRVLLRIDGRIDDYVVTPEGRRIMRFDYLFKDTHDIREAQVIQERLGEVVIKVVPGGPGVTRDLDEVRVLVKEWISPSLDVRFEIVGELPRQPGGKLRAVVSRLSSEQRDGRAVGLAATPVHKET